MDWGKESQHENIITLSCIMLKNGQTYFIFCHFLTLCMKRLWYVNKAETSHAKDPFYPHSRFCVHQGIKLSS